MRGGDGDILPVNSNNPLYVNSKTVRSRKNQGELGNTNFYTNAAQLENDYYARINQGNPGNPAYPGYSEPKRKEEPLYESIKNLNPRGENPNKSKKSKNTTRKGLFHRVFRKKKKTNELPPIPKNHTANRVNYQKRPLPNIPIKILREPTSNDKKTITDGIITISKSFCNLCKNNLKCEGNDCNICKKTNQMCENIQNPTYTNQPQLLVALNLAKKIIKLNNNTNSNVYEDPDDLDENSAV